MLTIEMCFHYLYYLLPLNLEMFSYNDFTLLKFACLFKS